MSDNEDGSLVELGRAPLFEGDPGPEISDLPAWLTLGPPKLGKSRWPKGARSATWLSMLDLCPRKHGRVYRDRIKSDKTIEMNVGTAVHFAFEAAAVRRIKGTMRGLPVTASVPELLHLVEFCEEARLDGQVLQNARELIEAYGPVDFTGVVQAESIVSFYATPSLRLAGYVDQVRLIGDPNDPDEVVVVDWKTGEKLPSVQEMTYDPQACLYVCAARRMWPNARRVVFELVNVRHAAKRWVPYSKRLERNFMAFVRSKVRLFQAGDTTAKIGTHCTWCHVRDDCPPHDQYLERAKRLPLAGSMHSLPLEQLISTYREMSVLSKLADARRKELGQLIDQHVPAEQKSYKTGRLNAIRKRDPVTSINGPGELIFELARLADVEPRALVEDVGKGVSMPNLRSWLNSLPEHLRDQADRIVEARTSKSYATSHIEVRTVKSKEVF